MIRSKLAQRIGGALIFLPGAGVTGWIWHRALTEGYYYRKSAMLFPAFLVIGLGMVLFPIDAEKLKAEYGVEKIQSYRHVPPAWLGGIISALLAGLADLYAVSPLAKSKIQKERVGFCFLQTLPNP